MWTKYIALLRIPSPSAMVLLHLTLLTGMMPIGGIAKADSAMALLSGFDETRLEGIIDGGDHSPNVSELAKLLYRLDQLDASTLDTYAERANPLPSTDLGDVVSISGTVGDVRRLRLSEDLAEVLEREHFFRVEIHSSTAADSKPPTSLYVSNVPARLAAGDSVSATGVVVEFQDVAGSRIPAALAVSQVRWVPANIANVGHQLLAAEGVNIAEVLSLVERDRQPLQAADNDVFYPMIAAASRVAIATSPPAHPLRPEELLQQPAKWIGDWIHLDAETVRVTRVEVANEQRRREIQNDAYFQIDAIGELGNVVIDLQRPEGEPVRFENRFPLSIVIKELPPFLDQAIRDTDGDRRGVALVTRRIAVDGFFYRLWSYKNDRMNREGSGDQIGPLIIAARVINLEIPGKDPIGVSKIGYIAAAGVLFAIVLTWIWSRSNRRADSNAHAAKDSRPVEDMSWLDDHVDP